jgi:trehalose 6-phosphate synthase
VNRGLHHAWDEGYVAVNRGFADAVLAELEREPDATVFFHDYHLYLAPRMVREERPEATLAHFMHIPWAQPDYWYVLPESIRRAIHDGVLANDVIGFHTARWRRNFLRSCFDVVGATSEPDFGSAEYRGRRVLVTAHPISVDVDEFEELATSPKVLAAEREIVERRPEFLVLRVDRTDPSKNVVRGFRAFELYLDEHPEMHERVTMLALLDPSRQDIPEYKQFDALLVNAIYDGLNLVAKEAPLVNERDGVLILSENAGVHEELGQWALSVNPFDVAGQAEAIHEALTLPGPERRERLEAIRAHVREHDLGAWIAAQLVDLDRGAALLQR